ncbi:YadA-like family protein [Burkholderia cenocepacia]|uniref:beta strand repeat-containing protein n=1 Tax=Burkholderia cenocepacia TaxID=95486 RepID=UPI000F59DA3F|nr:YadA-like family protein [Burkholderia cenocepacia]RQU83905.1 hypothetical protein DF040_33825 [Burkholderia cenocepacia]
MNRLAHFAGGGQLRARRTLMGATVASAVLAFAGHASAQYVAVNSTGIAAQASGTDSIAVGTAATAAGSDSTAIGVKARVVPAADTGSMALGYGATVAPGGATTSSGNLAIGMNATVGGNVTGDVTNAIAIGTSALSERSGGISIGASSHNAGAAIAIGNGANTGIDGQIAIGTNALADPSSYGTNGGVAIGQDSYASGVGAALGVGAHASGNSVAAGANSFAGWRDTVIGVQATATGNESVAIGYQSNDGGRDQVVSVGASGLTRAVTNVTAGTTATDAANVGQLPGTISGNVVTMGNALTPGASAGPATVTNVAAGSLTGGSTDAVNGSQLYTTNLAVTVNKQILDNLSGRVVNGTIGLVQQAGGAPGTGGITVGAQTGGTSVDFTGTDGARTLSGVAAGSAATDAVNVGQLNAVAAVAANSVQYDNAGHSSVTLGGAAAAAPVALTNVAAGALSASSTDAVNGGQLFATNQAVTNTSTAVTNLSSGINAGTVGLVQQTGGAPGSGPITVGAQTGGTSVDFTGTDGARTLSGVAAGAATTDAVNVGQLNTVAGVAANAVQYDNASHTSVTLGGAAAAAPVALTNVAAGALSASSTDAVNGGQLFATNQAVANTSTAVTNLSNGINAGTVGLVQQTGGAPGNGPIAVGAQTGGTSVDFTGTGGARKLSGVAAGSAATDAVNVGQLNAVAGVAANAVQYDNAGHSSVTLGGAAAAAPVALTNVAAGTLSASSADAVNGGQLFATNQAVTNLSNGINAGTVGLVQQAGGAPGSGAITVGAQTGGTSVDFTGTDGARTLSGVTAGSAATDAVNVGQLNAVAGVAANAVQYDNASHTSVTLGGAAAAAPVALTNVAAGTLSASSTDAVNGGQLFATNQAVTNASTAVTNLTNGINAGTIGLVQQTGGAPGNGPITVGAQTGGTSVDFTGTDGARTLSGVAAGTATTDAVNVGQLNAVAGVAANAVQYDNAGHTSVTLGGAAAAAPVALTNVAAGTLSASSTDAVNGAQLYATNQTVANTSTAVSNLTNGINAGTIGLVQQTGGAPGTGGITVGAQTGGTSVDFTGTDGARKLSGVAAGSAATDAVNVSQLNAAVAGATANAVVYDSSARSSVTLGGVGAATAVTLTNVATGALSAASLDAINGSQLYATNQAVAANTNAINALSNSLNGVQHTIDRMPTPIAPTSVPDYLKYFAANSTGASANASGSESVAAGGNSIASGSNSVAIGSSAQASGNGAVALGANASAKGANAVAIGQGSVASTDTTVSFGNSAAGLTRTLSNVSAGVAPTDAVNVQQLNDSVSSVRSQIEHDRADANGGTATAIAIASLPQAPAPGKSVVSVGGGTYAGQSAMAVGVSTYAGRWILKASGSTNTRGTVGAGVGAGYVW